MGVCYFGTLLPIALLFYILPERGFNMRLTSATMTDADFLAAIEDCSYPIAEFHHAEHLRLGWLLLSMMDFAPAAARAARAIRRLTQHNGVADAYHETVTQAWMRLLASHEERDFREFLALHGDRVSLDLLHRHWRRETLMSNAAKAHWVEPDLDPLPPIKRSHRPI
jgi:hypothetical protein